jgi:hypothetical protein
MRMLSSAAEAGEIKGIMITPDKCLLHQLFADDMGIFLETSQSEKFSKCSSYY